MDFEKMQETVVQRAIDGFVKDGKDLDDPFIRAAISSIKVSAKVSAQMLEEYHQAMTQQRE